MIPAAFLLALKPLPAAGTGDPSLLRRAEAFVRRTGFPGVWLCAAKNGRIVGAACAGYADPAADRPARLDDRLRIGSVSKPIFATVVAEAVRQGRIAYSDRAYDVVPELRDAGLRAYAGVTLEMLLAHTAGIVRDPLPFRFDGPPNPALFPTLRLRDALQGVRTPPLAKPGARYAYSNVGIVIAAIMLERKTHRSYEAWFEEVVTGRLRLASAALGEVADRGTAPHLLVDGRPEPSPRGVDGFYDYAPSGNVNATVEDVARFGLVHCEAPFGLRFFDDAFLAGLQGPVRGSIADRASFRRHRERDGGLTLRHAGTLVNQRGDATEIAIDPRTGVVVVAYTNVAQVPEKGRKSPNDLLKADLVDPLLNDLRHPSRRP